MLNLDAMEQDELLAFAYIADLRAQTLAHTRHGKGWRLLAQYARQRALAQRLRLAGDIQWALVWERQTDLLYRQLPGWCRW